MVPAPCGRRAGDPWGSIAADGSGAAVRYQYTGQEHDSTGLYDYHARAYDPYLGRFISADTIVPSPGDPQSLNRYSYALNNALKYTDPTGHYDEETQLKVWYGDDWRKLFSEEWQNILLMAEYGDAIAYGESQLDYFFLVMGATSDFAAWNINPNQPPNLGEVNFLEMYQKLDTDDIALYRAKSANIDGGPSSMPENFSLLPQKPNSCPSAPTDYRLVAGRAKYGVEKSLQPDWNLTPGGSRLNYHVEVASVVAGVESPTAFGWGSGIATIAGALLKDALSIVGLEFTLFDALTYDTNYIVVPNHPYPVPVPEPPITSTP